MSKLCYERARNGEQSAVETLVRNLSPRITKMAAYYARRCGEDPDDLAQEAWVGLLEALPDLDIRIGSPEQYLVQRARWRVLDALKRARVRRCSSLDDNDTESIPASISEMPVDEVCVTEFAGQLKITQQAVLDCLLLGLTWREAGSVLGCTSANIAYYVRQIRQQYIEWNEEPACSV